MITIEEFEVAAKDLAKAFKNLNAITMCYDEAHDNEAEGLRDIGNNARSVIKQYWIETASKRPNLK